MKVENDLLLEGKKKKQGCLQIAILGHGTS